MNAVRAAPFGSDSNRSASEDGRSPRLNKPGTTKWQQDNGNWAFHKPRVICLGDLRRARELPYASGAMPDNAELRFVGLAWAFLWGMPFFTATLALAWSRPEAWAKRLRWPVSVMAVLYLIAMIVMFATAKR